MGTMVQSEILKVKEVAAALRVHNKTIRRWIRAGSLPASRVGKSYYIRSEDLQAFLVSGIKQRGKDGSR